MKLLSRHVQLFRPLVAKYTILQWVLSFALADVNMHLEQGMQSLLSGQLNDALSHYHQAVESDPKNYLTYFKRSTVFQAMGRYKQALDDLKSSLNLQPEFVPARFQKAVILYRQGALDEAHIDFEQILRKDPHHEEATQYYTQIDTMKEHMSFLEGLILAEDWPMAIEYMNRLVPELYWCYRLKELRAEAFEKVGDYVSAVNDYRAMTKMRSDNTAAYYKLSILHYVLGEPDESLIAIRECLKLDSDHKKCHEHYKKVKKLANFYKIGSEAVGAEDFDKCADKLRSALKLETTETRIVHLVKSKLCHCLNKGGKNEDAIEVCSEALKLDPNDVYSLCDRADAYINLEEFDKAIHDYQSAHNIDENMSRAKEGFQRAQKLKKQSSKRDYYKILGVPRSATKKEITKAYRKLASKWHPDQFQGDEKIDAEKKFIDIAAAKEVLTNPEKRQKFDNGEDPLDPEAGGRGFNPFQGHRYHDDGGFNPFGGNGGGGYSFKFHFN